jgi:hypothetical protein
MVIDFTFELLLIILGLYYVFNYKNEAGKVISMKRIIKMLGQEVNFRQSKIFEFIYPYAMLTGGIVLIILGILALFHVVRISF